MAAYPALKPYTTPVDALILATDGLELVQVPPVVASVNVAVEPTHSTDGTPPIAAGPAANVTEKVSVELPEVKVTTTVPAEMPVTIQ